MPTNIPARIVHRHTSVEGLTPEVTKLAEGELTLNTVDGTIHFKNSAGDSIFTFKHKTDDIEVNQISSIEIESDGKLSLILDDSSKLTSAQSVVGPQGARGAQGPVGGKYSSDDILYVDTVSDIILTSHKFVLVDDTTASGTVTLTLPDPATLDGMAVEVKKVGSSFDVNINPFDVELIDQGSSHTLTAQGETIKLLAYSGNWFTF